MDLSPELEKAVDYLENLVKTTNLESYTDLGECKNFENMVFSFIRYIQLNHNKKDFYLLPNDNPTVRLIGFVAWYTDETEKAISQDWWIRLTSLKSMSGLSPLRAFITPTSNRIKLATICWLLGQDVEHFHDNLLIMDVHDS